MWIFLPFNRLQLQTGLKFCKSASSRVINHKNAATPCGTRKKTALIGGCLKHGCVHFFFFFLHFWMWLDYKPWKVKNVPVLEFPIKTLNIFSTPPLGGVLLFDDFGELLFLCWWKRLIKTSALFPSTWKHRLRPSFLFHSHFPDRQQDVITLLNSYRRPWRNNPVVHDVMGSVFTPHGLHELSEHACVPIEILLWNLFAQLTGDKLGMEQSGMWFQYKHRL